MSLAIKLIKNNSPLGRLDLNRYQRLEQDFNNIPFHGPIPIGEFHEFMQLCGHEIRYEEGFCSDAPGSFALNRCFLYLMTTVSQ